MVNVIVATDEHMGIGKDGDMPWPRNSEDMTHFKYWTMGKHNGGVPGVVIMGRRTWESIGSKPLPGRHNIVLTTKEIAGVETWNGPIEDLVSDLSARHDTDNIWIIGGGEVYKQVAELGLYDMLFHTIIPGNYGCDTFLTNDIFEGMKPYDWYDGETCRFEVYHRPYEEEQ